MRRQRCCAVCKVTGQLDMVGQVLVDNFVFNLLIYFPTFYTIKALVQGGKNDSVSDRVHGGLSKYWNNFTTDAMASCAVWIPADFFIFACPMYLRMPLDHGVSFGWTMFISFYRGAATEKSETKSEP